MRFIEDLKDGEALLGHYYCRDKQTLKSRAGKTYVSLVLADRTGSLDAKIWEINANIGEFTVGDYVKVDGSLTVFNDDLQLRVYKIRKSREDEIILSNYLPGPSFDVNEMFQNLMGYAETIENEHIAALINTIFSDEDIVSKFKMSTAAKTMHHSYAGGLLEHTLAVVTLCNYVASRYQNLNRDMLIAAAMLHDIGKIWELTGYPENNYTDSGQLLGHIFMAAELVTTKAAELEGFPPTLAMLLKHCILAHHGEHEFGSPKLPAIIEAQVLFACDNMDAKITAFTDILDEDKSPGLWTGYNRMFQRSLRKTEFTES